MIGDFMQLEGMGGQVLEKRMFDPRPRLPKWEEGYGNMGDANNWAARGPWWQTNEPLWGEQSLYSGMGDAAQGTWLGPGQVAPGQLETAASMVAQRQQWQLGARDAAQGTWLGPNQVSPAEVESAAQLIAPHPAILASVKAARRRRRQKAAGMGDWMELSGIADVAMSPLGLLAIGGLAYLAWKSKGK
jgi:hypothetical protein